MNHEFPSQIDESLELGIEPDHIFMPINGYRDGSHISHGDGRRLFLIGGIGKMEGGEELGEFVPLDTGELHVTEVEGFTGEAREHQIAILKGAGNKILDNGDPQRFLAVKKWETWG